MDLDTIKIKLLGIHSHSAANVTAWQVLVCPFCSQAADGMPPVYVSRMNTGVLQCEKDGRHVGYNTPTYGTNKTVMIELLHSPDFYYPKGWDGEEAWELLWKSDSMEVYKIVVKPEVPKIQIKGIASGEYIMFPMDYSGSMKAERILKNTTAAIDMATSMEDEPEINLEKSIVEMIKKTLGSTDNPVWVEIDNTEIVSIADNFKKGQLTDAPKQEILPNPRSAWGQKIKDKLSKL